MKTSFAIVPVVALGLAAACNMAMATEFGTVLSSTPVMAQVNVPVQSCSVQPEVVQPRTSGGGALLGALVGGVVGHNLGGGFGRAVTTGVGVMAGSIVGNNIEAANNPGRLENVQTCAVSNTTQSQLVGYDVSYRYNGQTYTTRMGQPLQPGSALALNVDVAAPPVSYVQSYGVVAAPVVSVGLGYGYGPRWGYGHRHW